MIIIINIIIIISIFIISLVMIINMGPRIDRQGLEWWTKDGGFDMGMGAWNGGFDMGGLGMGGPDMGALILYGACNGGPRL